jgi:hypothetical protein
MIRPLCLGTEETERERTLSEYETERERWKDERRAVKS